MQNFSPAQSFYSMADQGGTMPGDSNTDRGHDFAQAISWAGRYRINSIESWPDISVNDTITHQMMSSISSVWVQTTNFTFELITDKLIQYKQKKLK